MTVTSSTIYQHNCERDKKFSNAATMGSLGKDNWTLVEADFSAFSILISFCPFCGSDLEKERVRDTFEVGLWKEREVVSKLEEGLLIEQREE